MIVSTILGMIAGICLYVGLLHLLISYRKLKPLLNFFFALTCLMLMIYSFGLIGQYSATDVENYIKAQKIVCSSGYLVGIAFVRFIAIYTRITPVRLLLILHGLYIISLFVNLTSPTGIIYSSIDGLSKIYLPWGEFISSPQGGTLSPLFVFQLLALNSNTIFVFYACYRQYRRGEKQASLVVVVSSAIFAVTLQHDRLIDLQKIKSVYVAQFGFLSFVIIMSLYLVRTVFQAATLQQKLQESERLRKLAVEEERNRLARELHDSVSQTLFTVSTIAQTLPRLWQRHPEIFTQGLNELIQLSQAALAEMRNLLLELRPSSFSAQSLEILLQQLIKGIQGRAKLEIITTIKGNPSLSEKEKLVFYRISQESLNNIIKHAKATHVSVLLEDNSHELTLSIEDNGCGFDPNNIAPGCLGISILKERAQSIGAEFYLNSHAGQGTEIKVKWAKSANLNP